MVWSIANSNLALVKYWGKADDRSNQAARGSLSITLDGLTTAASVEFDARLADDRVEWRPAGPEVPVRRFLDVARIRFGLRHRARVTVTSNFPVAAGLASSASTFAALAAATTSAAGRPLDVTGLAALARAGSGSACRSVLGGFVEWRPGGAEPEVVEVAAADHWPLVVLVAVVSEDPKRVGSREGMARTAATSPYYGAWLDAGEEDLAAVREAVRDRDLRKLGTHAERNCLRMHAAALGAVPPLLYFEPATVAVVREVWRLRERGVEAYFSIDAGPQVKVLCEAAVASDVEEAIARVPGVRRVIRSGPGGPPRILDRPPSWASEGGAEREQVRPSEERSREGGEHRTGPSVSKGEGGLPGPTRSGGRGSPRPSEERSREGGEHRTGPSVSK